MPNKLMHYIMIQKMMKSMMVLIKIVKYELKFIHLYIYKIFLINRPGSCQWKKSKEKL